MSELTSILSELKQVPDPLMGKEVDKLVEHILNAKRIYFSGSGRSGLMVQAFANRLMQLGLTVSVVGEISEPRTRPGDLVIFNSASGNSSKLISQANIAKHNDVKIGVVTTDLFSPLAGLADIVIKIEAQSKLSKAMSFQPMGSLFEQMSLLLFDSISLKLMKIMDIDEKTMRENHADIE